MFFNRLCRMNSDCKPKLTESVSILESDSESECTLKSGLMIQDLWQIATFLDTCTQSSLLFGAQE